MIELDDSQRKAVELVRDARLGIVTGGPGTGKTTSLRVALDELDAAHDATPRPCEACGGAAKDPLSPWGSSCLTCDGTGKITPAPPYVLAAPTGKAARRMEEATGRASQTLHRLLEYSPRVGRFLRNAERPIEAKLVIVDESSMLDLELAAALTDAIDPTATRLVFVGDANQLPPVGPGKPFFDLISSGAAPVARLTKLHRAAAESWVCTQAPRALAGEMPALLERPDFRFVEVEITAHVPAAVVEAAKKLAGAGVDDVQVLAPQRSGPAGTQTINDAMQAALNPRGKPWIAGKGTFPRVGDRVIQTENNYELGVMNGEVGRVVGVDDALARLNVDFGDRVVPYTRAAAHELRLAYAITCHKSQGSEWPWVIVVVHKTHSMMLTRGLFYTAITRARAGVVIVGDRAGIKRAVDNVRDTVRNSSLVARIGKVAS